METISVEDILIARERVRFVLKKFWVYYHISIQHADRGEDCKCGLSKGLSASDIPIGCCCNMFFPESLFLYDSIMCKVLHKYQAFVLVILLQRLEIIYLVFAVYHITCT